jgi:hypothetical protein
VLARCRLSVLKKTGVGVGWGWGGGSANEDAARDENVPRFVVDKPRLKSESKEGDLREEGSRVKDNKSTSR